MSKYEHHNHQPRNGRLPNLPNDITRRELMINRLVCNEMSPAERIEFVKSMGDDNNCWRDVALAFMEDQALSRVFLDSPDRRQPVGSHAFPESEENSSSGSWSPVIGDATTTLSQPKSNNTPRKHGYWTWAIAATVIFALLGGVFIGDSLNWFRHASSPSAQSTDPATGPTNPSEMADLPQHSRVPVAHSVLRIPHQGTGLNSEVPIYEVPELTQTSWENSLSDEVKDTLYRGGYRFEPSTRFVRAQLDDHRDLLVPIHEFNLKSIVQ